MNNYKINYKVINNRVKIDIDGDNNDYYSIESLQKQIKNSYERIEYHQEQIIKLQSLIVEAEKIQKMVDEYDKNK